MAGLCRAPGCGKSATRYGHFCTTHKSRWRRHGDVGQVGITKEVLKPYTDLVRARIEKNAGNPTWTTCDDRWQAVVAHARGIIGDADRGVAGSRNERMAAATDNSKKLLAPISAAGAATHHATPSFLLSQ